MGTGRRRQRRQKRYGSGTMFFPAKYQKYADIVSLESPAKARESKRELLNEYRSAKTNDKKVRVKRSAVLAMNRAEVTLKRKNLSDKERKEFREIKQIYASTISKMLEIQSEES